MVKSKKSEPSRVVKPVAVPPAEPLQPVQIQLLDHKTVEDFLLELPNTVCDYPFGADVAVYKSAPLGAKPDEYKMFALIAEGSSPLRLSLKCDPQLAIVLREKYETVMPGFHLSKKHWNTLLLSGQVPWEEVQGLIHHSYILVTGGAGIVPDSARAA